MTDTCPDAQDLATILDGDRDSAHVERILAHADRCAACTELIGTLGRPGGAPVTIARYELGNVLGAGAMGIVHEAWDPQLHRRVALKLVRPERADDGARARMLREARALGRVNHPNVVAVYDVTEVDNQICVATELVDGETLATWQRGRGRAEVVGAWLQAARGLAAAHAVGVVHRDVKPANVLIDREGRVRVGDFGLASFAGHEPVTGPGASGALGAADTLITTAGFVAGTPAYMAPEQACGQADARSDQYSLAASLVEGLTGAPGTIGAPTTIDGPLGDVLARSLAEDPALRFATLDAWIAAVTAAIAPPRRRWPIALAAIAVAAAAALATVLVVRGRAAGPACEVEAMPPALWSTARRTAIARDLGDPLAAYVDRWTAAWSAAAVDVCATGRDEGVARRRRACLADLRDQLDARLARLGATRDRMAAFTSIEDLATPERCSAGLMAHALEPSLFQALAIEPVRRSMRDGRPTTIGTLRQWWASAKAIGYVPHAVDTGILLAQNVGRVRPELAVSVLHDVVALADARGDDRSRINAAVDLLRLLPPSALPEARQLAETTRARIAQLGGNRELEGNLDAALARVFLGSHLWEEEIAACNRAIAAFELGRDSLHVAVLELMVSTAYVARDPESKDARAAWTRATAMFARLGLPDPAIAVDLRPEADPMTVIDQLHRLIATAEARSPGSVDVASGEGAIAATYRLAGDPGAAIAHYTRALELYDRAGVHDSSVATALVNLADLQLDAGQWRDGLATATRAATACEALGLDSWLDAALASQGRAYLELGDVARARPVLERAVEITRRIHEQPRFRAKPELLLARATWPRDPRRARQLARAALADFETAIAALDPKAARDRTFGPHLVASRDEAVAWLAAHR